MTTKFTPEHILEMLKAIKTLCHQNKFNSKEFLKSYPSYYSFKKVFKDKGILFYEKGKPKWVTAEPNLIMAKAILKIYKNNLEVLKENRNPNLMSKSELFAGANIKTQLNLEDSQNIEELEVALDTEVKDIEVENEEFRLNKIIADLQVDKKTLEDKLNSSLWRIENKFSIENKNIKIQNDYLKVKAEGLLGIEKSYNKLFSKFNKLELKNKEIEVEIEGLLKTNDDLIERNNNLILKLGEGQKLAFDTVNLKNEFEKLSLESKDFQKILFEKNAMILSLKDKNSIQEQEIETIKSRKTPDKKPLLKNTNDDSPVSKKLKIFGITVYSIEINK